MKLMLKKWFEQYWPSLLTGPVFVFVACRYMYGDVYFYSLSNFIWITLIWMLTLFILSGGSLWVRSVMLKVFHKMDDWAPRIVLTLIGYLAFAAIPTWLVFQTLKILPFPQLVPLEKRFYVIWWVPIILTFLYATIYECITFFSKWKEAIAETDKLEKLTLEGQFRSLQSQLNPHFLFNSFNVLSSLINEHPRKAERFVDELSNVYRYLLKANEKELATVEDELKFVRSFFHLLKTRHDQSIELYIDVPTEYFKYKLPSLALQVLIENAVKHNEISPEKPLHIELALEHTFLVVRNNVQPRTNKAISNKVGLDNLRDRYQLLNKDGFKINRSNTLFEVLLPLIN